MLYDVLDISRHIINYSDRKRLVGVSNLKLTKLLLFCTGIFHVKRKKDHAPCFQ